MYAITAHDRALIDEAIAAGAVRLRLPAGYDIENRGKIEKRIIVMAVDQDADGFLDPPWNHSPAIIFCW